MVEYNVSKLSKELVAAGLVIDGSDSDGKISWKNEPTVDQLAIAEAVLANHDPTPEIAHEQTDIYANLLKALTPESNGDYDFEVATAVATWVTSSPAAMLWVTPALNRKSAVLDKDLLKRAAAFIKQEIADEKLPVIAGNKLLEILGSLI